MDLSEEEQQQNISMGLNPDGTAPDGSWPSDYLAENPPPEETQQETQQEVVQETPVIQTPEQYAADAAIVQREQEAAQQGMESAPESPAAQEAAQAAERILAGYEQEQKQAEEQGLIALGGGITETPEQYQQRLTESKERVDTRMLLGSIESEGGVQGAIEAGDINKVREAIDRGLYTVKDETTGLDRPMTRLDLVDQQITLANRRSFEQAMTELKSIAPQSITDDGILIRDALNAGVSETTLRLLNIPDSAIQEAKLEARIPGPRYGQGIYGPPNLSEYGGVVRPPIESFIAQYAAEHPIEYPEGLNTNQRREYLDMALAEQRIKATQAYQDTYGTKGMLAGTGLAAGELVSPAFKVFEPSIGLGGLSNTDKIFIAVQAALLTAPFAKDALGAIVKGTPVGKIPVNAPKWTNEFGQTFKPAEKITLASRYFGQKFEPEYLNEVSRIAAENRWNVNQWVKAVNARDIYNEGLGAPGPEFPNGWQPPGWNIPGAKPTDWTPPGWSTSGGKATPPESNVTDADVARLLGDVELGGNRSSVATIARVAEPVTTPARPITIPEPAISPTMPGEIPLPGSPEILTPNYPFIIPTPPPSPQKPGEPGIPVVPAVPSPIIQPTPPPLPVIAPQPVIAPTPVIEPNPITTPATGQPPIVEPVPEPTPVIETVPETEKPPTEPITPVPTIPIIDVPPPVPGINEPPPPPPPVPPSVPKIPFIPIGGAGGYGGGGGGSSGLSITTSLSGQVRDAVTNAPIVKAKVKIQSVSGAVSQRLTNKYGVYQFRDINPGYYTVATEKPNYDVVQAKTVVNPGDNQLNLKPRQSRLSVKGQTTIIGPALQTLARQSPNYVPSRPNIIALKRGREYVAIYPPYQPNNIVHMIQPPTGATMAKSIGQMYKLIQAMGGNGSVLVNLYEGNKHDDARFNKRMINVENPVALQKWLKNPGRGDVMGKDTPKFRPVKVRTPRALMLRRK